MGGLLGIVLILGGFEGHHVVERSQFHSCHNSHKQWLHISRVALPRRLAGVFAGVCAGVVRYPLVVRIRVRDGNRQDREQE